MISFPHSRPSVYGLSEDTFTFQYKCDGVRDLSGPVFVSSSIADVQILT